MLSEVWDRRLCLIVFVLLAVQSAVAVLWFGGVTGSAQGVLLLLACVTVLTWLVVAVGNPSAVTRWPVLGWLVTLTLVYVTYRYRTAEIEYVARREWLLFFAMGSQFLVALDLFHRRNECQRWIVFVIAGLASVASFFALFQFFGGNSTVWGAGRPPQYGSRGSGTFINPNHFAAFLELALFPTLALLFLGRFGVVGRLVLGYLALVIGVGIFVSVSRGAYVATVSGLILFLGFMVCVRRLRRTALILLVFLLLAGATIVTSSSVVRTRLTHFSNVIRGQDDDARLKIWRSAWMVFEEEPEWGVGPGHFEFRYFKYRLPYYQRSAVRVHNDWLNVLVDYGVWGGLLGLAMLVVLIACFVGHALEFVRAESDDSTRRSKREVLAFGAGLSAIVFALHCLVDFLIYLPALIGGVALLLAVVATPRGSGKSWFNDRWGKCLQRGQIVILFMIALPIGVYGARLSKESYQLRIATRAKPSPAIRFGGLERAAAMEPNNDHTQFLLGEHYREISAMGDQNWEDAAEISLSHFQVASQLNPYRHETWVRIGYCLDWLGRYEEGGGAFERAQSLDPNGSKTMAWVGWHLTQLGEYQKAIDQFLRSLNHLPAEGNPLAATYLKHARDRLVKP